MRTALALGACVLAAVGCAPKHAPAHVGRAEKSGAVEGSPPVSTAPGSTSTTMARATTTTTKAVRRTRKRPTQLAPVPHEGSLGDRIARCESGGNYKAQNPRSSASGKYQYLDSTWARFGGYESAKDAPPAVQEARFAHDLATVGTSPWNASRGCWG